MFRYFALAFFAISTCVLAKEDCSDDAYSSPEYAYVSEKYFYQGTCHYRNKEYDLAAVKWRELVNYDGEPDCCLDLKISASNNLGYLLFFGFGVEENKQEALSHWHYAVSKGQTESEYHLCHAYADLDQPTYDKERAKLHCEKARLVYQGIENPNSDEIQILELIRNYVDALD